MIAVDKRDEATLLPLIKRWMTRNNYNMTAGKRTAIWKSMAIHTEL